MAEVEAAVDAAAMEDPREFLKLMARLALDEIGEDQAVLRIVMREGDNSPALRDEFHRRIVSRGHAKLAGDLRARARRGGVDPPDLDALAAVLLGSVINYRVLETLFGRPPGDVGEDRFIETWADASFAMLAATSSWTRPLTRSEPNERPHRQSPRRDPGPSPVARPPPGPDRAVGDARAALVLRRLPGGHRRVGERARAVRRAPRDRCRGAVRGPGLLLTIAAFTLHRRRGGGRAHVARVRRAPHGLAPVQPRALRDRGRGRELRGPRRTGGRRRAGPGAGPTAPRGPPRRAAGPRGGAHRARVRWRRRPAGARHLRVREAGVRGGARAHARVRPPSGDPRGLRRARSTPPRGPTACPGTSRRWRPPRPRRWPDASSAWTSAR